MEGNLDVARIEHNANSASHSRRREVGTEAGADSTSVSVSLQDLSPLNASGGAIDGTGGLGDVSNALSIVEFGLRTALQTLNAEDGVVGVLLGAATTVANKNSTSIQTDGGSGLLGARVFGLLGNLLIGGLSRHYSDLMK